VIYQRDVPQFDIFMRAADGSSPEELIVTSPNDKEPTTVSSDGLRVLYSDEGLKGADIYAARIGAGPKQPPEKVVSEPGTQEFARVSPDGKWLTYTSDESGRQEVYLTAFPPSGSRTRVQVSVAGGHGAEWRNDGRSIYYSNNQRVFKVAVNPSSGEIGSPQTLDKLVKVENWTAAPDGRFLILRAPSGPA
jgi:Tol biopolymer transport system component